MHLLLDARDKLIVMEIRSAEITKYASNCMLATKISLMNELANICEKVGANIMHVRSGIGSDRRIGYQFIYPGIGYGGSCFPKDVRALIKTAKAAGIEPDLISAVDTVNNRQKRVLSNKIMHYFKDRGNLENITVALWGSHSSPTQMISESPQPSIPFDYYPKRNEDQGLRSCSNQNANELLRI